MWSVVRQDDNGNIYIVTRGLDEHTARAQAIAYQQRGHKQLYWIEPDATATELSRRWG